MAGSQELPVVVALGTVDRRCSAGLPGIAVVITPGAGAAAVAEGTIGMALHLVKRSGPLTALVREGRWAWRTQSRTKEFQP
jgi:phosphoglycerate dehydrogenase-like enzyme